MTEAVRSFLEIALELQLLDPQETQELQAEAERQGVAPMQLVVQKGRLNLQQIDVIETLRQPLTAIPGYEILGVLGQGGMGVVYKARQTSMRREVALKTILLSQREDPTSVSRFEQEAQTEGRLAHPHIVTAYDFGRHEGRLYLAMELLSGADLADYVGQHGPLDETVAWGLIRQAAAGLAHAAALGIVHRDIKPANLLLVEPPAGFPLPAGQPMVKIADFGLAFLTRDVDQQTRLTAVDTTVGSPHYMAPEQLAGATVDHRSDVYALGCTAYCLLAGVPPFHGLKLPQIIAGKLGAGPTPIRQLRPDLSGASEQLLHDMMCRHPAERIADYATLFARLEPWAGGARPVRIDAAALAATQSMPVVKPPDGIETDALGSATISAASPPPKRGSFRALGRVGLALALLGAVALGAGYFLGNGEWDRESNRPGPALTPPPRAPVIWQKHLFNGKDITNWKTYSGGWLRGENDDRARVIEGSDGVLGQWLIKDGAGPLTQYRLELLTQAKTAKAVELHFAIGSENDPHSPRLALRLEGTSARLGTAPGDDGPFQPMEQFAPVAIDVFRPTSIRLESQNGLLWVSVNNQLVGQAPYPEALLLPEFRLRVENGVAWFSDVTLSELEPPSAAPPQGD